MNIFPNIFLTILRICFQKVFAFFERSVSCLVIYISKKTFLGIIIHYIDFDWSPFGRLRARASSTSSGSRPSLRSSASACAPSSSAEDRIRGVVAGRYESYDKHLSKFTIFQILQWLRRQLRPSITSKIGADTAENDPDFGKNLTNFDKIGAGHSQPSTPSSSALRGSLRSEVARMPP